MKAINKILNIWFFIAIAVAVLPFIIPGQYSNYIMGVMCFIAIYGALSLGMGLLLEQAGLFSLAHPCWFGIGAYITGILAVRGMPTLAAIIIAALCVAFLAYLVGAPLLRLKGYYLACATFAMILIVDITIPQLGSITGGHDGLLGIPPLSVAGFKLSGDLHFYFLTWGLCFGTYWFLNNLMRSRVGRAIKSFNDSEVASKCAGVDIAGYKLKMFILTAVMASLAGSLFCFYLRYVNAMMFGFPLLVELMTMIIIGGGKTLYGPLLGSFVILWFREFMHMYLGKILPMTGQVDATFFGIIIVLILIFMPGGLAGWLEQLIHAVRGVRERLSRE
jgi:branched-chain amino acid transport system permease protein